LGFSAIIIAGGVIASYSGRDIAQITGLSHTFVGTFLLAVVTSLPEVAVSVGALRLGEVDMALGNLLGSNVFNVSLIFLVDAVYHRGAIFASASTSHILTAIEFLMLSSITLIALSYRVPRKHFLGLGVDSLCILGIYLGGILGLFRR
jgi:cation:H+ antiporter